MCYDDDDNHEEEGEFLMKNYYLYYLGNDVPLYENIYILF